MTSQVDQAPQLPNIVYFHGGYQEKPFECTDAIAEVMGCTYTLPGTWSDLTRELEAGAEYVAFHAAYVTHTGGNVKDFAEAIFTLAERMPNFTKLNIGVVIKRDTDSSVIKELTRSKVSGILLDVHDYPMEEVCAATIALLSDKPHWPEHIISQLPDADKLPLSIYFREDWKTYITPAMLEKFKENSRFDVAYCSDWTDLDAALDMNPHQLIFHISMLNRLNTNIADLMLMLKTRVSLSGLDIPIAVGIEPTTNTNIIKDLKSNGVFGITPSAAHWGLVEITTAINALAERIPYWPEHIISQLPGGKPRYIHFREHANSKRAIPLKTLEIFEKVLPVEVVCVAGLDKLDISLASNPAGLIFNIENVIANPTITLQDMMSMIQTKLKILNLDIPILVAVNKDTPATYIAQLKREGVQGILPINLFGTNEVLKAIQASINGESYWPTHIIDQLPVGKPRYIYFREDEKTHITPEIQEIYKNALPVDMVHIVGWENLDHALASDPKVVAFNIKTLSYNPSLTLQELISMIQSKMKLANLHIPLVVGINKDTPQSIIKQLKKEGIHSICPTFDFGIDEVIKAMESYAINGMHYWPKHIIDQLPQPAKKKNKFNTILLTSRQTQVLGLIRDRGESNKMIARALNLRESTIKMHVGTILKKYGLTNRTQLALIKDDNIKA
jgi:DNA-binding NarL/FixJ family response regulator